MRILILGGTVFVGRHLTEAALKSNHVVTLFHRGKHSPGLFGEAVETVHGDRTSADDLAILAEGRTWDVVIDTCAYVPRVTQMALDALKDSTRTYCFISTISVYADRTAETLSEDSPMATLEDPTVEQVTGTTYGGLKVLCEKAVRDTVGADRALIIRPGYIAGPHDPTDRFTYWVHRVAQGGDILAPGDESTAQQFIDARDLAEWNIRLLENGVTGTFNADGYPTTLGELLPLCRNAAGLTSDQARFVYAPGDFLEAQGVSLGRDLPLWVPASKNDRSATIDVSRGVANGLTLRPLAETIADTLAWDKSRTDTETAYRNTLSREKEAEVLAALAAR